ncbi:MAG: SufE family protein [Bacteroidales bacterium]|nr:SufE family protein [Bacteroidales bacterium]MCL2133926.1 SufE family protein [Bacteroidales bacterium]
MSIAEKEQSIIAEFELFPDWLDKYEHLIDLGKALPPFDPKLKTEQRLIEGCQSRVWLAATCDNGLVYYTADSDAIITKGIVSLLIHVLSGQTPQEILEAPLDFIQKIGLKENLSPTRTNGLLSMAKQMKLYALVFQQQGEK